MASQNIKEATDQNFQAEVLGADKPSLVDFWAPWCGPCRAIAPIIDELADENAGQINIFKMNTDDNQQMPVKYGVRGIPMLILFKGGQVVGQLNGAVPKSAIQELLAKA
jgi:thioredoxin 1